PANHRNGRFDVAIAGNKIARVAPDLPAAHARAVIDASAYFVTPGLIDTGANFEGMLPDPHTLSNGVTTIVSANGKTSAHIKTRLIANPGAATIGLSMMTAFSDSLNRGMTLDRLVEQATVNAASVIRRPELGRISDDSAADVAVLEMQNKRVRC